MADSERSAGPDEASVSRVDVLNADAAGYWSTGSLCRLPSSPTEGYGHPSTSSQKRDHVRFRYDPTGALSAETTGIGDSTYYDYDAAGRRSLRIDPDLRASYYDYDAAGRMTGRLEPDSGPAYFSYDAAGNRIMMQDGSGASYFSYDALNRLTGEEKI